MDTLAVIQREVGSWAWRQFGNNPSHWNKYQQTGCQLGSLPPLMGMMGELGELVQQDCKRHQGRIKGVEEDQVKFRADQADALADILVFMCDYATRECVDLSEALQRTWNKVKQRTQATWEADQVREAASGDTAGFRPTNEQERELVARQQGADPDRIQIASDAAAIVPQYRQEDERLVLVDELKETDPIGELVCVALSHGWRIDFFHDMGKTLFLPYDSSNDWCGNYFLKVIDGYGAVKIPSFLRRRMTELKHHLPNSEGRVVPDGWLVARQIVNSYTDGQHRKIALAEIERKEQEYIAATKK